jgi:hypothetical protein
MIVSLIVLQLVTAAALLWVATRKRVSPVLSVSLVFAFLLWYVAPLATLLIAPERVIPRMIVPVDHFVRQGVIETAAFLLALIGFAVSPLFRSIAGGHLASHRLTWMQYATSVVAGALVFVVVHRSLLAITGSTYSEINSFSVLSEGSSAAAKVGLLVFAEGVLLAFSYACAVTPLRRGKAINLLIWTWIVGGTFSVVLLGGRVALLAPVALLVMRLHEQRTPASTLLAAYGALFVVTATIGVIATIAIANARGEDRITVSEAERQSKDVAESSVVHEKLWEAFDHVNLKFDSISSGALLIDRYRSGVAGMRPYTGALLAFVPRRVLPSKPVPGSIDGTIRGTPSRLVAEATLAYDPDTGNVGVSPAAIAMWQFGLLGLVPLIILNVLQLRVINSLLLPPSIATRTLAMFLIGIPAFTGVFSPADLLIMNLERMLAVYAAATLVLFGARQLRRRLPEAAAAVPTR